MFKKAIIINSLPRSGSNIIWNIIGSSPDVQMTLEEFHNLSNLDKNLLVRLLMRLSVISGNIPLMTTYLRESLHKSTERAKQQNTQKWNERSLDSSKAEYMCFKVMGGDNRFNDIISKCFDTVQFVYIIRDPEAICDSYYRRGINARFAAKMYGKTLNRMHKSHQKNPKNIWINFEDLAQQPTQTIQSLYQKLGISPPPDKKYLYKTKKFGPGHETDSQATHQKILVDIEEYKNTLQHQPSQHYLEKIPREYWNTFQNTLQSILDV